MIYNLKNKIFIIAEIGVNHNGNLSLAKKLILAAKKSGADAVKFQNFTAEKLVTKDAKKAPYQAKNTKNNKSQLDMLKKLELKKDYYYELLKFCKSKKIKFLSSVFDNESIVFLKNELKINTIKIPSGEITNPLILDRLNLKHYYVILSTGMSNIKEIVNAINIISKKVIYKIVNKKIIINNKKEFNIIKKKLIVMHCVTDYPVEDHYANLQCINTLQNDLKIEIGYSDHTKGIIAPLIAVSKGAKVIEKHFTLNKNMNGPDHLASLNPQEFKKMVENIRTFETMNGAGIKKMFNCERINRRIARKSLIANSVIKKGERFTHKNITTKRPGNGVCSSKIKKYINTISKKNYQPDDFI
jgi:N,N'-diacetyllegionaminate synthase